MKPATKQRKKLRTENTKAISKRFLQVMEEIIAKKRGAKERFNITDFAKSIRTDAPNFYKIKDGKRDVSVALVSELCLNHNVNPTWLILAKGAMFLDEVPKNGVASKFEELEKRLKRLEKKL